LSQPTTEKEPQTDAAINAAKTAKPGAQDAKSHTTEELLQDWLSREKELRSELLQAQQHNQKLERTLSEMVQSRRDSQPGRRRVHSDHPHSEAAEMKNQGT